MRQLTFVGVRRLEWQEVPEPWLQSPREALVRPLAVARCDLDPVYLRQPLGSALHLGIATHQLDRVATQAIGGAPPYAPPFPVGHECVGEVSAIGPEVRYVRVGQRVVVPFQVSCGQCRPCGDQLTSRCAETTASESTATYGFGPGAAQYGGMLSDLVRVPYADAMLVPVPDGIDSNAIASASDNLPDAFRCVGPLLRERPFASVLVVGGAASSIGLYAAAIARALDASEVDYVDTNRERLELAERLGARAIQTRGGSLFRAYPPLSRRYDISVDACSDPFGRGLELALRSLEPGGVCTSAGLYPRARTPVPLMQMYLDGTTLRTGITNARRYIPEVLDLVASGRLDPTPVATLVAPWNDADRAFLEPTTKVIIARA